MTNSEPTTPQGYFISIVDFICIYFTLTILGARFQIRCLGFGSRRARGQVRPTAFLLLWPLRAKGRVARRSAAEFFFIHDLTGPIACCGIIIFPESGCSFRKRAGRSHPRHPCDATGFYITESETEQQFDNYRFPIGFDQCSFFWGIGGASF